MNPRTMPARSAPAAVRSPWRNAGVRSGLGSMPLGCALPKLRSSRARVEKGRGLLQERRDARWRHLPENRHGLSNLSMLNGPGKRLDQHSIAYGIETYVDHFPQALARIDGTVVGTLEIQPAAQGGISDGDRGSGPRHGPAEQRRQELVSRSQGSDAGPSYGPISRKPSTFATDVRPRR